MSSATSSLMGALNVTQVPLVKKQKQKGNKFERWLIILCTINGRIYAC